MLLGKCGMSFCRSFTEMARLYLQPECLVYLCRQICRHRIRRGERERERERERENWWQKEVQEENQEEASVTLIKLQKNVTCEAASVSWFSYAVSKRH